MKPVTTPRRRRRGEEPPPEEEVPTVEAEDEEDSEPPYDPGKPIRVAIVGRPNAGKSTLVNTILGEERMITGPEPGLTRDSIASDITWQDRPIRLFDTAGLRRKARIDELAEKLAASDAVRAIRFAEVVVLLIDPDRAFEQQDLTIGNMIIEEGRALVIAINKWDLVEDKEAVLKDLRETVAEKFAEAAGVTVVTLSAASGRGVDRLMKSILDAHAIWARRVSTADINRWLRVATRAARAAAIEGPPHPHSLHDAGLGAAADVRRLLLAAGRHPGVVSALSHQQHPRGVRPAGDADPHQPAQGREPLRGQIAAPRWPIARHFH